MVDADRDTLFDLIAAVNANRRSLDAAALHARDPARKGQCQRLSRAQATAVARITRDIARHDSRHAALPRRQLKLYIDRLIDAYVDEGDAS